MRIPFTNIVIGIGLDKSLEKRSGHNPFDAVFHGQNFGVTNVSRSSAASISAWWRGTNIISWAIAGLPKTLFRETSTGREKVTDHPAIKLIRWEPNINQDAYSWHEYMVGAIINYGNGYSLIERDSNMNPTGLIVVHPDRVEVKVVNSLVIYEVKTGTNGAEGGVIVGYDDMYHVKGQTFDGGYEGVNPIQIHRTTLGTSISAQDYNKDFYDNNTNLEGYLMYDGTLDAGKKEDIQTSWRKTYSGTGKNKTALIDAGWTYHQLGMKPEDAQYLETRKFLNTEIAVMLGIPPSMLGDMSKTTFNNSEQQDIAFVKYTLMSYIQKFEIENRKLLTEAQKQTHFWKYNANGLMRGDSESRSKFMEALYKVSAITPNQIRDLEDMNGYEGGDRYYSQTNNATPVDRIDEIIDAEINKNDNGTGNTDV